MRHALFVALLLAAASPLLGQVPADQIFRNGRIWTGEPAHPYAEALAVTGDRIAAVGSDAEVGTMQGPRTVVTDLAHRLVLPGFIDSHWHFTPDDRADLAEAGNVGEIVRRLQAYAAGHPHGWIRGWGWSYTDFPDRLPHRRYLDQAFPARPAVIWERDGHMLLANTAALKAAGLDRRAADPPNGRIERGPDGDLTGELKEAAMSLVTGLLPPPTADEVYEALQRTLRQAASYGLTSVHNVSRGLSATEMAAFERAALEQSLPVRVYAAVPFSKDATDADLAGWVALKARYHGPLLKFGAAKAILDGTVDARTAAMFEPYVGAGSETGIPMWRGDDLNRTVARYDSAGLQVMLHAIGDRAIRMALDAYEHAMRVNHTGGRRHRVEHVEVPDPADLPRFRSLGVIASTQAMFAYPDATTLDNYAALLGPVRASHANAFGRLDDAGAMQAFGSDYPVFTMEVLKGIHTAVTRTTVDGTPSGGWYPENRITVEAALRHFTRDGAYASFDEQDKGTLAPGKLADFVVLSRNVLAEPPSALLQARVLLTVMGGKETWHAAPAAWDGR